MPFEEAFDHVRNKSVKVDPNVGFLIQLQEIQPHAKPLPPFPTNLQII